MRITPPTRIGLDHDRNDQVYGLDVSDTIGPSLVQVMVSPGKAEAILHDSSRRGFSTAGRWQFDFSSRATIVGSAFYRRATEVDPKSGAGGIAFGFAPTSHVSLWTEADTDLETKAAGGPLVDHANQQDAGGAGRGGARGQSAIAVADGRRFRESVEISQGVIPVVIAEGAEAPHPADPHRRSRSRRT